jgi:hypothetical protein
MKIQNLARSSITSIQKHLKKLLLIFLEKLYWGELLLLQNSFCDSKHKQISG